MGRDRKSKQKGQDQKRWLRTLALHKVLIMLRVRTVYAKSITRIGLVFVFRLQRQALRFYTSTRAWHPICQHYHWFWAGFVVQRRLVKNRNILRNIFASVAGTSLLLVPYHQNISNIIFVFLNTSHKICDLAKKNSLQYPGPYTIFQKVNPHTWKHFIFLVR